MEVERQTPDDLIRENIVATEFASVYEFHQKKFNKRFGAYDREFHDTNGGGLLSIAEVKCRRETSDHYHTYMIEPHKIRAIRDAAAHLGVPSLLIVAYFDGMWWLDLDRMGSPQERPGGRTDRGDRADYGPRIYIHKTHFHRFSGLDVWSEWAKSGRGGGQDRSAGAG